jgi:hypothetical protein
MLNLDHMIKEIEQYYIYWGRTNIPKDEQFKMYHEELVWLTDEQVSMALKAMRNLPTFPYNLPLAIKVAGGELCSAQDNEPIDYGECSSCHKTGIINIFYEDCEIGLFYTTTVFCADCQNYKNKTNMKNPFLFSRIHPQIITFEALYHGILHGVKAGNEIFFMTADNKAIDKIQTQTTGNLFLM